MRAALACVAFVLSLSLAACVTRPSVFVLHSPIQPTNAETISYRALASSSIGVAAIEIWETYDTAETCPDQLEGVLFLALACTPPRPPALIKTCTFDPPTVQAQCDASRSALPDGSFVTYRALARDTRGREGADGWISYAAGQFSNPNDPIPIYVRGDPNANIDIVFIPDTDYNNNDALFIDVVEGLMNFGYLSSLPHSALVRSYRTHWNFYVTYQDGDATGYVPGQSCLSSPPNWANLLTVVDAGVIVHSQGLRDCGQSPPNGTFTIQQGDNITAIHETGHTVFALADEYCCDGGYRMIATHPNLYNSEAACETAGNTDCVALEFDVACPGGGVRDSPDPNWWRSNDPNDIMQCGDRVNHKPDSDRIFWVYDTLDGL